MTRIVCIFFSFYLLAQLIGPSASEWKETYIPSSSRIHATSLFVNTR